jgi:hypothetical protein
MCDRDDFAAHGYANGVPMGGVLEGGGTPSFAVWAAADPDICPAGSECDTVLTSANFLQRVQMVKVWVDGSGNAQEQVWDIACANGDPVDGQCPAFNESELIDENSCEVDRTAGATELCSVWSDPGFDAGEHASYYIRVLENPVCRWSSYVCDEHFASSGQNCDSWDEDVEDPTLFRGCCNSPRTIQERAWSSPIYYTP